MKKEKVFCNKCRFFIQDPFFDFYVKCSSPHTRVVVRTKDNYYCESNVIEKFGDPSKINKFNNCKHFLAIPKPLIKEPVKKKWWKVW